MILHISKNIVSSSGSLRKRNTRSSLAVIFIPNFKEDDHMASAKYTKGADGYYQARVWDGTYDEKGRKHRKTIRSDKSSKDLERKVAVFQEEVQQRKAVRKTDLTFLEYARTWMAVYKDQKEANTKAMYANIIEKHFIALETVKLSDIERIHLQLLLNNASGKARTQQQIMLAFKQVLRSAVVDHLFPANIAEDIFLHTESIKYTPKEKRPLTPEEREAVFKANLREHDKIFVYLLYGCGLRRGEALALTVFDIKGHELTVSKSHEFTQNTPAAKCPKSSNGYRTVPIPDKIYPAVSAYVAKRKASGKTYLFTMRNGKLVTKSSYRKMWERIIRQMQEVCSDQIVDLTTHVFRHNYCTNLCYQIPTVSIKRIAQLLGDTEKMVLDVYNHIILEKEDAAAAVNNAINF